VSYSQIIFTAVSTKEIDQELKQLSGRIPAAQLMDFLDSEKFLNYVLAFNSTNTQNTQSHTCLLCIISRAYSVLSEQVHFVIATDRTKEPMTKVQKG
jgi:hypothetical protein